MPRAGSDITYNQEQQRLDREMARRLEWAMMANHGATEETREEGREMAHKRNWPITCEGRPGTGKTTVVLRRARAAAAEGAHVLLTSVTLSLIHI